ncbi:carbohydrate kinase [Actinobacteria bacterium YIM 96077]|uniref:Carbohydrate kinase n=1 Tax=Phytoactinopolyspora halophila TaxID=1981511 RepID=A0A329R3S8_9ACTN|nr:carbohydrate kinase [Phytoactinopolyspora halophila]AYY12129.1 carbohydrate kinase [Actinobacteria bacterium YIM 96077]RAW18636.1 carbohydrate kinase [Phytoactinopolyspora halophila]
MAEESIIVAGEVVVDLIAEPGGRYRPVPGGSPANVAVGLSRLGARTQLLARLGSGAFHRLVHEHLRGNGVLLDYAVDADEPQTLAVVSVDDAGHARYDFYADGTADWQWSPDELPDPLPDGTLALCTGSIAAARQPGSPALLQLLRREHERARASIVLDPNIRPRLLDEPRSTRAYWNTLIELADIVKVSDEDLAWLDPGFETEETVRDWADRGPALVVATRGDAGVFAVTSEGVEVSVPAPAVEVVDTVGAGDAFTSGLLDGLRLADLLGAAGRGALTKISAHQLEHILERAIEVAALTCTRQGADPPAASELERTGPA